MKQYSWLLLLAACGPGDGGARTAIAAPATPGQQYIVAIDLSGSQSADRRLESRRALDGVIAGLSYGDRIVLLQMHQGGTQEDGARRWTDTVPRPRSARGPNSLDAEKLEAVQQAARSVGRAFFETDAAGKLPNTDIFSTLHVAAEFVRDADARTTTLVLLSDMLQSAHGVEMSKAGGAPSAEWIAQQRQRGLLPRLEMVCVVVIGADASNANGMAVQEFWQEYFTEAGAALYLENYRLIEASGTPGRCRK